MSLDYLAVPEPGVPVTSVLRIRSTVGFDVGFTVAVTFPDHWTLLDGTTAFADFLTAGDEKAYEFVVEPSFQEGTWESVADVELPQNLLAMGYDNYRVVHYGIMELGGEYWLGEQYRVLDWVYSPSGGGAQTAVLPAPRAVCYAKSGRESLSAQAGVPASGMYQGSCDGCEIEGGGGIWPVGNTTGELQHGPNPYRLTGYVTLHENGPGEPAGQSRPGSNLRVHIHAYFRDSVSGHIYYRFPVVMTTTDDGGGWGPICLDLAPGAAILVEVVSTDSTSPSEHFQDWGRDYSVTSCAAYADPFGRGCHREPDRIYRAFSKPYDVTESPWPVGWNEWCPNIELAYDIYGRSGDRFVPNSYYATEIRDFMANEGERSTRYSRYPVSVIFKFDATGGIGWGDITIGTYLPTPEHPNPRSVSWHYATLAHEYGHHVLYAEGLGNVPYARFNEGWARFFASAVEEPGEWEDPNRDEAWPEARDGEELQENVAAYLWDLYDSSPGEQLPSSRCQGEDSVSEPFVAILDVLKEKPCDLVNPCDVIPHEYISYYGHWRRLYEPVSTGFLALSYSNYVTEDADAEAACSP